MKSHFALLFLYCTVGGAALNAQSGLLRHEIEVGGSGLFPIGGYKADEYSAGPGLRAGYEFRATRHWGGEVGWNGAWIPGTSCSRLGCGHPRYGLKLLDYGLRGTLPLAAGRLELSAGVGGGYIWYAKESSDSYSNGSLFQYSGKAAVAIDSRKRFRAGLEVRAWRDLGRPIQQWLTTNASLGYCF